MSFKFSATTPNNETFIENQLVSESGYEISIVSEQISGETEWTFVRDRTSLIIHLGGDIKEIESEFDGKGSKLEPPLPGEMWLIPSNVRYSSRVSGTSAKYIEISFDFPLFSNTETKNAIRPIAGGFDRTLIHKAWQLLEAENNGNDVSALTIYETLSDMAAHIEDSFLLAPEPKTKRPVTFSKQQKAVVESYILDNLEHQISLNDLSGLAGETPHRFLWAFRNAFGDTPAQFILNHRVRKARHLLQTTRSDITTIAMETGFADHSHLTTAFRKATGITPSQFRTLTQLNKITM